MLKRICTSYRVRAKTDIGKDCAEGFKGLVFSERAEEIDGLDHPSTESLAQCEPAHYEETDSIEHYLATLERVVGAPVWIASFGPCWEDKLELLPSHTPRWFASDAQIAGLGAVDMRLGTVTVRGSSGSGKAYLAAVLCQLLEAARAFRRKEVHVTLERANGGVVVLLRGLRCVLIAMRVWVHVSKATRARRKQSGECEDMEMSDKENGEEETSEEEDLRVPPGEVVFMNEEDGDSAARRWLSEQVIPKLAARIL